MRVGALAERTLNTLYAIDDIPAEPHPAAVDITHDRPTTPNNLTLPHWAKRRLYFLANQQDERVQDIFEMVLLAGSDAVYNEAAYVSAWHTLTPKELEVAALVCVGRTNDEICRELSIVLSTVKTHVGNILQKFGAENRVDLQHRLAWWDVEIWLVQNSDT